MWFLLVAKQTSPCSFPVHVVTGSNSYLPPFEQPFGIFPFITPRMTLDSLGQGQVPRGNPFHFRHSCASQGGRAGNLCPWYRHPHSLLLHGGGRPGFPGATSRGSHSGPADWVRGLGPACTWDLCGMGHVSSSGHGPWAYPVSHGGWTWLSLAAHGQGDSGIKMKGTDGLTPLYLVNCLTEVEEWLLHELGPVLGMYSVDDHSSLKKTFFPRV